MQILQLHTSILTTELASKLAHIMFLPNLINAEIWNVQFNCG